LRLASCQFCSALMCCCVFCGVLCRGTQLPQQGRGGGGPRGGRGGFR
jgi:hypothetical protein